MMDRLATRNSGARGSAVEAEESQRLLDRMRAAEHPFCLFCGKENPIGFKLAFRASEPGTVRAAFRCGHLFQGYPRTLHGGVISALLDSAMANCLFSQGVVAVTAEMTVRYLRAADVDCESEVTATTEKSSSPLYSLSAEIRQRGRVVARATAKFVTREWAAAIASLT